MEPGSEISVEIDPGKTLEIRLLAIGETNDEGFNKVFFELNGQPRDIMIPNRLVTDKAPQRLKADANKKGHVGAPMPGMIATLAVEVGRSVQVGDLLMTIEAMKMETGLHADVAGVVTAVHVTAGEQIDAKDLLMEIETASADD